jgi:arylsulfatase A-like enzyme
MARLNGSLFRWPATGLLTLASACGPADELPTNELPRPRNVLLISIDSLRADHLGCYGYEHDTSPALDALARRGVLFETCVAESSWTLPTHASLLTGVSSGAHGLDHDGIALPAALPTLAEHLSAAGWRTRGLWSGPYLHPVFGFGRGFAPGDYEGLLPSTRYDSEEYERTGKTSLNPHTDDNRLAHRAATAEAVVERAMAFVDEVGDERFFLFVHLFDVHYDFVPPEAIWRRFDPDYAGSIDGRDFIIDDAIHADMDPVDLAHLLALYDGEVAHTDAQIGRLLEHLAQAGRDEDTLIVVTSDHGDEFFEHGEKGHRLTLYEEVLDVPLIMAGAGVADPGRRLQGVTEHADVTPTILELLGLPAAEYVTGSSLAAALAGDELPADRVGVARLRRSAQRLITSVRGADWKVVIDRIEKTGVERIACYDLSTDPAEQHPITDSEMLRIARRAIAYRDEREGELQRLLGEGAAASMPGELDEDLRALGYVR